LKLSDSELETLLAAGESDRVAFEESFQGEAPTTVRQAVRAFANDLPGHGAPGVVFFGLKDDGSPSGLSITDALLTALSDIRSDGNIVPPPLLTVEKRSLRGAELAVILVQPADAPPVRYKGQIWIRVGPRRCTASAQEERVLSERRRHRDRPFDIQPVRGSSLVDLDVDFFERTYLPAAVAPEVLAANARSREERLAATKMISELEAPRATVLGILVLGKEPRTYLEGSYVQFLRFQGTALSDPTIDEFAIDGTILDLVRRLDEKLVAHNRVAVDFTSGPVEKRHWLYPLPALQQIVRNAILHRSYEATNAPVRVYWFDDRIEVSSPGGPYGMVNERNFGAPHITDYRNPNLAEAMRVLGLVQKFGGGIAIARELLRSNGNPELEFQVSATHVLVTLRPRG
jgi:ATP-dependent DNA helicase RecG